VSESGWTVGSSGTVVVVGGAGTVVEVVGVGVVVVGGGVTVVGGTGNVVVVAAGAVVVVVEVVVVAGGAQGSTWSGRPENDESRRPATPSVVGGAEPSLSGTLSVVAGSPGSLVSIGADVVVVLVEVVVVVGDVVVVVVDGVVVVVDDVVVVVVVEASAAMTGSSAAVVVVVVGTAAQATGIGDAATPVTVSRPGRARSAHAVAVFSRVVPRSASVSAYTAGPHAACCPGASGPSPHGITPPSSGSVTVAGSADLTSWIVG
jgi:hypothetical protein